MISIRLDKNLSTQSPVEEDDCQAEPVEALNHLLRKIECQPEHVEAHVRPFDKLRVTTVWESFM